jgi:hypothetical protein
VFFDCELKWNVNRKPYVWLGDGHDTEIAKEIAKLNERERWELAFQLSSVLKRGESLVIINGRKFLLDLQSFDCDMA